MVAAEHKLISSVGYCLRVAKKFNVSTDVVDHLEAAMMYMLNAKKMQTTRVTICLAECLSPPDIDEQEVEAKHRVLSCHAAGDDDVAAEGSVNAHFQFQLVGDRADNTQVTCPSLLGSEATENRRQRGHRSR